MRKSLWALTLLVSILAGCTLQPISAPAGGRTSDSGAIVYLIPAGERGVEKAFTSASLNDAKVLPVLPVTDWREVQAAHERAELDALIIHHDATESVDTDELEEMAWGGVTVAGIGIPGDMLAALMGMPYLNDSGFVSSYGDTNDYFYAYTLSPGGRRMTTDSIGNPEGVWRMLTVITEHLARDESAK